MTSFDPNTGKLVITLNDGTTTETGQVTSDTEFECQSMDQTTQGDDGSPGDSGGDNQGDNGGDNQGDNGNGDDNGNDGGDDQGDQGQPQNCSAANLTPGTTVQGAELRISSDGAVWEKIEL